MSASTMVAALVVPAAAMMPLVTVGCGGSTDSPTIGIRVDGRRVEADVDGGELCYELDGTRQCFEVTDIEPSPTATLIDGRPASVLLDDDGEPRAISVCDLDPDARLVEVDC